MIRFQFRLQRVLDFRRTQFQIAEAACQRAGIQLHGIQAQQAALQSRKFETRKAIASLPEATGRELAPLPAWYRWTETERKRLTVLENAAAQDLQKRRQALVEAQRKVRLLEKLHDRRQAEWQCEFDHEIEELAADAFNSRFLRSGSGL
jgi:hypothetical protein